MDRSESIGGQPDTVGKEAKQWLQITVPRVKETDWPIRSGLRASSGSWMSMQFQSCVCLSVGGRSMTKPSSDIFTKIIFSDVVCSSVTELLPSVHM